MKRTLESYLNLDYPFIVRPDTDDGGYIVEFQDLRYCVGTGDTVEEAIADAKIAKSEWIKAAYEDGITIPEPQSNAEYNGRISLRIPKSLHRNIIEASKIDGVSANQFLNNLICIGMGKRTGSRFV
jgi:antitoxin HicB